MGLLARCGGGGDGLTEFQAKDGKVYTRLWTQGTSRVGRPVDTETLTNATGTTSREWQAMLYAAPTNAPAPARRPVHAGPRSEREGKPGWRSTPGMDLPVGMLQLS